MTLRNMALDAADRMRDNIYEAINKLADMPGMGHRREDLTRQALLFWPVGKYLIIYRPDTAPLEIVRVVSGYRDWWADGMISLKHD